MVIVDCVVIIVTALSLCHHCHWLCVIIDIGIGSPGLQRLGAVCDDPGVVGVDHAGVVLLLVHVVDHVPLHPLQISHLQYCHSREMSKQFNY